VNEKAGGPSEKEVSEAEEPISESSYAVVGDSSRVLVETEEEALVEQDALTLVQEMSDLEKEKVRILDEILGETDPKFDYGASIIPGGDSDGGGPL
jgi:hypothetical protein